METLLPTSAPPGSPAGLWRSLRQPGGHSRVLLQKLGGILVPKTSGTRCQRGSVEQMFLQPPPPRPCQPWPGRDGSLPPQSQTADCTFLSHRGEWRRNWPYPLMDGCSIFVSQRWREAQYEVDCGVY